LTRSAVPGLQPDLLGSVTEQDPLPLADEEFPVDSDPGLERSAHRHLAAPDICRHAHTVLNIVGERVTPSLLDHSLAKTTFGS
jgi:hypothetical protein